MLTDGVTAISLTALVCVLPGWMWARLLWPDSPDEGWTERITLAAALSLALVPATALVLARLLGSGVTTGIAAASVAVVLATGTALFALLGPAAPAKTLARQAIPRSTPGTVPLVLMALAFGLVFASDAISPRAYWFSTVGCWGWGGADCAAAGSVQRFIPLVALLLISAAAVYLYRKYRRRNDVAPAHLEAADESSPDSPTGWWKLLLPAVVIAVVVRNFSGVVLHDWPFVRGVDHYSHAVMANRMMSEGHIEPYFIYPSGFHIVVANISRLGGLDPLDIFPFLGPLLPVLPVLACYTLAKRVWGWQAGLAAAFLVGLVAGGTYFYLTDSMYPNLVGAQFLLVMTVAAMVALYSSPSARSVVMVALLGSSVVLFHQVASLYLAFVLACVTLLVLPALFLRDRGAGVALIASFALMWFVAFFYAWDIYALPTVVASTIGATDPGSTREAVSSAIGTQAPFSTGTLIGGLISQPVAWLSLIGVSIAVGTMWLAQDGKPAAKATLATLLLWVAVILAGSTTSLSGFPQRFGRDLGVPLSLFAAFALVWLLRSLARVPRERSVSFYAATASVALVMLLVGIKVGQGVQQAVTPSWRMTITPEIAAAGDWLRENNTGGNIMVAPQRNQVPSRMMLAMGDYSALQSFTEANIELNRDLPPGGAGPLRDVLSVVYHPAGEEAERILERYDVRYIVHYKDMPDRGVVEYWREFEMFPDLYENVFENSDVVVYAPRASGFTS